MLPDTLLQARAATNATLPQQSKVCGWALDNSPYTTIKNMSIILIAISSCSVMSRGSLKTTLPQQSVHPAATGLRAACGRRTVPVLLAPLPTAVVLVCNFTEVLAHIKQMSKQVTMTKYALNIFLSLPVLPQSLPDRSRARLCQVAARKTVAKHTHTQ